MRRPTFIFGAFGEQILQDGGSKMFGIFDDRFGLRVLTAAADGKVIPIGELGDGELSKRKMGDGFAVYPHTGLISKREIVLYSPADGVITAAYNGGAVLRTGDGISISVLFGDGGKLCAETGERVAAGSVLCVLPEKSGLINGAAAVLINEAESITEMHVRSGYRRHGDAAAFYRVSE